MMEILLFKNIKWTLRQNKKIKDIHEIGDIIFVKKDIIKLGKLNSIQK